MTSVILGHPFNTIKVYIQNKTSFKHLTFFQLYRGWKLPFISDTCYICFIIPFYMSQKNNISNPYVLGAVTGICSFPMVFYFDTCKILRQTQQSIHINNILTRKGKYTCFLRELLAMTFYLPLYEKGKEYKLHPLLSGSFTGLFVWTLTYPIDVIRNRQIAKNIDIKKAYDMNCLWKGYSICAVRAIIVNAGLFGTYECIRNLVS